LCLKDNNLKAKELYQKYNSIESEKIEHPEFYHYWSSDGFLPPSHPVDLKELCQDPIETINNFDPSKCKKATFTDDGRSRVEYLYIFISDYKNASLLPFKFGEISFNKERNIYVTITLKHFIIDLSIFSVRLASDMFS
jgi:hypothetical protein